MTAFRAVLGEEIRSGVKECARGEREREHASEGNAEGTAVKTSRAARG